MMFPRLRSILRHLVPKAVLAALRGPTFEEVQIAERRFYRDNICSGMTIFDVGANIGELTLLFAELAETGTVHAFEANPKVFISLEQAVANSEHGNIVANPLALSDAPGSIALHCYDPPFDAFSTAAVRELGDVGVDPTSVRICLVEATTLDAYCTKHSIAQIDLLKIDVEGAEQQVMQGASMVLAQQRIDCVVFEYGSATYDMGNSATAIRDLLGRHGYRIKPIGRSRAFPIRDDRERAGFAMYVARP